MQSHGFLGSFHLSSLSFGMGVIRGALDRMINVGNRIEDTEPMNLGACYALSWAV